MAERKKRKGRRWALLGGVIAIIVVIRLVLPYVVLHYANKSLEKLDGYWGHIDDINLAVIRGAYVINGLRIDKVDSVSMEKEPFISTEKIDLSLEWHSLLKGRIVGEITFLNPVLRLVKDKAEPKDIEKDTSDFREVFQDLMPLKVNTLVITNGKIHYVDYAGKPPVDIFMDRINLVAKNFSSVEDTSLLPAIIEANANVYGGNLSFQMRMDPLGELPAFDMNAELTNTNLKELNSFFKAYGNIDVNKGTFGLYTEIAADKGKFIGYVKPVIKDLDIIGPQDKKDSFLNKVWEGIVAGAGKILENKPKDQVATKIPMEGSLKDISVGTLYAVIGLLRNAFIMALHPSIDYEIDIESIDEAKPKDKRNILEKIFGTSDKKDGKKENKGDKDEK